MKRTSSTTPTTIRFAPGEVEHFVRETKAFVFWIKVIAALWSAVTVGTIVLLLADMHRAAGGWSGVWDFFKGALQ
ncbi:MAG: hypothetical protein WAQ08_15895 [Aquabacterium sp.]|uniref:hypothetical protein n=1 Tax=Aquabacterium sp. TaxID=1872578 RepID=UPI003BB1035D